MSSLTVDSDDEEPQLSAHTLAALQEFMTEHIDQQLNEKSTEHFPSEDWQLSQFWYDDATKKMFAKEVLAIAGENGRIACVSCPSLYAELRHSKPSTCSIVIYEFDKRFQKYGNDFQYYDYKDPLNLPEVDEASFDIVVADPPFLSEECLQNVSQTIKYLAKDKVVLCTGAVMEKLAVELLNVKLCTFLPKHTNNLANDFRCFTNYPTLFLNETS